MESLGLDITRPYRDLYSFDSKKVKCLGLIKDMVISLTQIPAKSLIMDVIVANILVKFGMLLSRSCSTKPKGTLQMDMSYATIPVFEEHIRLYREARLVYMVSSKDKPKNHPIYFIDTKLGSSIFYNNLHFEEETSEQESLVLQNDLEDVETKHKLNE